MTLVFGKHKGLQIKWLAVPLIELMLVGILSSCTLTGDVDKVDSDSPTTKITEQVIPTALYDEVCVVSV